MILLVHQRHRIAEPISNPATEALFSTAPYPVGCCQGAQADPEFGLVHRDGAVDQVG